MGLVGVMGSEIESSGGGDEDTAHTTNIPKAGAGVLGTAAVAPKRDMIANG